MAKSKVQSLHNDLRMAKNAYLQVEGNFQQAAREATILGRSLSIVMARNGIETVEIKMEDVDSQPDSALSVRVENGLIIFARMSGLEPVVPDKEG